MSIQLLEKTDAPLWYRPARQLAMQALYQQDFHPLETEELIRDYMKYFDLERVQAEYFKNILSGVIDSGADMDASVLSLLDRSIDRLDILERVLLRIGAWELHQKKRIPARKIIAENVHLAGIFGGTDSYKYINAVLHKLAEKNQLL